MSANAGGGADAKLRVVTRWARWSLLALALMLWSTSAWAQPVAVVATGDQATEVTRYLAQQLDRPVAVKNSENARRLEALVAEARRDWEEDLVVVIDTDGATVSVLRPSDGTVTSRALDPAAAKAPYAVALAAVELIDLVVAAPVARAASLPPARPPVRPRPAPPPADRPPAPSAPPAAEEEPYVAPAICIGAMQTLSSSGDIGLLQPTFGVDMEFRRPPRATWFALGLHMAGLTGRTLENVVPPPPDSNQPGNIRYRRDEIAIRPQVGHGSKAGSAVGWLNIGASRVEVTVSDHAGNLLLSDVRGAFWTGFGGELRYAIAGGVSAAIGAGLAWYPQRSRVHDGSAESASAVLFEEGPVEFRGRLTLVWEARR